MPLAPEAPGRGRAAGRLRQAGWWRGESCDEVLMDAVRADFPGTSRVPA
jgi:hypothetical protein